MPYSHQSYCVTLHAISWRPKLERLFLHKIISPIHKNFTLSHYSMNMSVEADVPSLLSQEGIFMTIFWADTNKRIEHPNG